MHQASASRILAGISAAALLLACGGGAEPPAAQQAQDASASVVTTAFYDALDSFNTANWNKANWTNGGMFNCGFLPDHVNFSGGIMNIRLDNYSSFGKPYSSGEYRTNSTFGYGTFETNMKATKASGIVSSFFLYTGSPWDEIDVEFLGKNTTQVQFNYFVNGVGGHEKIINLGFDASAGYHKYAIEYGNGYINWYVDGVWKWGVNNTGLNAPAGAAMPSHPMQIMMNLWPGIGVDGWLGSFTYPGTLYAYYDYVKFTPK
jgi:beta-glucanase (GH16 family)